MQPLYVDIERQTLNNECYRRTLFTSQTMQLNVQSLEPGEFVDFEKHDICQFIRVEKGKGFVIINNIKYILEDGIGIIIPENTYHYIEAETQLKFYTIYSFPEHDSDIC